MPHPRPYRYGTAVAFSLALTLPAALLTTTTALAAPVAKPAKPYDFNGDGFPELVVGVPGLQVGKQQAGGVVVLPASRSGLSLDAQVVTQQTPGVPDGADHYPNFGTTLTSADFDRDGYADLAVSGYTQDTSAGSGITILFGTAQGLTGARSFNLGRQSYEAEDLQTADLDGDGWVDLVTGEPLADIPERDPAKVPGAVRVYRGSAQGFSSARSWVLRGDRQGTDVDLNFGSSLGVGDLNGDGFADLAVTAPGREGFDDDDEGFQNPGSVSVCYGGKNGPTGCARLVRGFAYAGTTSVAVGNVSGDARPEIVVGLPFPELIYDASGGYEETREGGAVEIFSLAGSGGATTATVKQLTQDSKGVPGSDEAYDGFGGSLVVGDLDRDGYADLVVGAGSEALGKKKSAGRVTVVYGAAKGYRTSDAKIYDQDTKGIPGKPEEYDFFGHSLTLLDHDSDGRLDLTVGATGEDRNAKTVPGAVTTLRGSGSSFTTKKARTFGLKTLGYAQAGESEFFGEVLGR